MDKQFITKINGIEISAVRDENHIFFVPVKPICQAIGIDFPAQYSRINRHHILSSTVVTVTTVAADEKEREMVCLRPPGGGAFVSVLRPLLLRK